MSGTSPDLTDAPNGHLASRSFLGLLATQTLGALNDNMFRWLVVPIGQQVMDATTALSLGAVCFTIPYLLLAPAAGSIADRFSKRTVIVACKLAEIVIMALGLTAILIGSAPALFAVVAIMGSQSALFGPAKFGSLPEMLSSRALSKGNGYMGLVTVVASALGTVAGYALYSQSGLSLQGTTTIEQIAPVAAALIGVAVAGWLTSLLIARQPAANPQRTIAANPITQTVPAVRLLAADKPLLRAALGIAFFWMLASLAQLNVDRYGEELLGLDQQTIGLLLAVMVAGVGTGSVLAGILSRGKVELGLVPLGAAGIAVSSLMLFVAGNGINPLEPGSLSDARTWAAVWLFSLGLSAGLFNIPLEAYLQHRSETRTRGTILAASNFISFSCILVSAGLFALLHGVLELSAGAVFMVAGLGTIPVIVYAFTLLPEATIRMILWLATGTIYRRRLYGLRNLPEHGGALLVANHVSWVDGLLLFVASSRPIRFLIYADYADKPVMRWFTKRLGLIPVKSSAGPKALLRALEVARAAIEHGQLVCIFAEGQITRTGQLQPFQRGLLRIVQGTGAPVIPVFLHGLWGSIFSYHNGRLLWKKPHQWPYPVSIHFGRPLAEPDDVAEVHRAVEALGVEAMAAETRDRLIPVRQFIRECKRTRSAPKVVDSSGVELTGGRLLAGSLAFRRVLSRTLGSEERNVGLLIPPSVGGVLANMAVALDRRVAVNLNYTLTDDVINYCVRRAEVKHVLTSRRFLEKKPMQVDAELIYLEDLKGEVTKVDKAAAAIGAFALPAVVLDRLLGLHSTGVDELATIIFTSGSTGEPKGVMLSHGNVGANVNAVQDLLDLRDTDAMLGVLPFFHSFGYTGTMWLVLCCPPRGVYHVNPLDSRTIGKLCDRHEVTIVMATPTFLKSYMKRCTPEQMRALDLVVAGAEKLPLDVAKAFEEKFRVFPTEGYGTTELSPVVAVNIPDHRTNNAQVRGSKPGTVGRPLPGVAAKVVDPDTFADLELGKEGLLLVKGPNVMCGYLHDEEKTAEVIRDGWYVTGDYGFVDDEGFITITGRQSRFSKIGGEMVPHVRIEEELARIIEEHSEPAETEDDMPVLQIAVTSVPDEKKGERIVVLHRELPIPVDQFLRELKETGLPNLWLPGSDSFFEVEEIPILGTGKLDLKALQQRALDLNKGNSQDDRLSETA